MGYSWDITIDSGTEATDPKKKTLKLHPGVVTRIGCKFAEGCNGYVKVRLTRGGVFQIYPLSAGEWVSGNDEEVWFPYYYVLTDTPYELLFEGISPEADYDHDVTIRIAVLPKSVASMIPVINLLTRLLQRMGVMR